MYQDAIDMLSGLLKTTPGLKGIKVKAYGKVDLVFSNKSVKVNNSISMLEKIEDVKSNYHG